MTDPEHLSLLRDVLPWLESVAANCGEGDIESVTARTQHAIAALERRVNPPPDPILSRQHNALPTIC